MHKLKPSRGCQSTRTIIKVVPQVRKKARKLGLINQLDEQISLFTNNPKHPSLNLEKLELKKRNIWSFRINDQWRALTVKDKNTIWIYDLVDYH